jgi:hypothetical protein
MIPPPGARPPWSSVLSSPLAGRVRRARGGGGSARARPPRRPPRRPRPRARAPRAPPRPRGRGGARAAAADRLFCPKIITFQPTHVSSPAQPFASTHEDRHGNTIPCCPPVSHNLSCTLRLPCPRAPPTRGPARPARPARARGGPPPSARAAVAGPRAAFKPKPRRKSHAPVAGALRRLAQNVWPRGRRRPTVRRPAAAWSTLHPAAPAIPAPAACPVPCCAPGPPHGPLTAPARPPRRAQRPASAAPPPPPPGPVADRTTCAPSFSSRGPGRAAAGPPRGPLPARARAGAAAPGLAPAACAPASGTAPQQLRLCLKPSAPAPPRRAGRPPLARPGEALALTQDAQPCCCHKGCLGYYYFVPRGHAGAAPRPPRAGRAPRGGRAPGARRRPSLRLYCCQGTAPKVFRPGRPPLLSAPRPPAARHCPMRARARGARRARPCPRLLHPPSPPSSPHATCHCQEDLSSIHAPPSRPPLPACPDADAPPPPPASPLHRPRGT